MEAEEGCRPGNFAILVEGTVLKGGGLCVDLDGLGRGSGWAKGMLAGGLESILMA